MQKQAVRGESVNFLTRYAYGLGEFGFSLFLVFISYYLLSFLTDVAQFPASTAAVIYSLVQWFECITLLGSGFLMDRFHLKSGKYRSWILIGAIMCAVGMVLFFTKWALPQGIYIIVFPVCYLIAYAGYNLMWVAYRALMSRIGRNQKDTVALTTSAGQLGTVAMLIFSALGARLLYSFDRIETGFAISAWIYAIVIMICGVVVFRLARPYDTPDDEATRTAAYQPINIRHTLKSISGQMIPFFVAFVLRGIVQQIIPSLMVYHFTYAIGNAAGIQYYMIVYMVAQMLALLIIKPVTNFLGKKRAFIISSLSTTVLLCIAYFFSRDLTVFLAIMGLNAFVTTFSASMLPAFLSDIADYNEYMLGSKDRSFTMSVGAMVLTVASLLGSAIAAFGLASTGYSGAMTALPEEMVEKITQVMLFGGAICALLSVAPMLFYKLNEKTMGEVYARRDELEANG